MEITSSEILSPNRIALLSLDYVVAFISEVWFYLCNGILPNFVIGYILWNKGDHSCYLSPPCILILLPYFMF